MASLVAWLAYDGARKSDGTAVASGSAYFYQPGTTATQISIYSDEDGLVALSQPVTLDAAGRAVVYTQAPARVLIQDASGVTVRDEERVNTIAASQVEVTNAGFTGTSLTSGALVAGGRTDLNTVLTSLYTTFNSADAKVKPTGTATGRYLYTLLGRWLSPGDFGALGDDSNDDTSAWQQCLTSAASTNKSIWIDPGTYRISTGLGLTGASAAGLVIEGANRATCIIKNMSATNDALTFDLSSAIESHITLRNFTITANTTSTGSAIVLVNGDGVRLERMNVALHRIGYHASAVAFPYFHDCLVTSTDSNSAGRGFKVGLHATMENCRVIDAGAGRGFSIEDDFSVARDCKVIAAATGIGFVVAGDDCAVERCFAGGAATGISVGAVARAYIVGNKFGTNSTIDLSINGSATSAIEHSNSYAGITDSAGTGHAFLNSRRKLNLRVTPSSSSASTATLTPSIATGDNLAYHTCNYGVGDTTITVNATATTGLASGDHLVIVVNRAGVANNAPMVFNAQYQIAGGGFPAAAAGGPSQVDSTYIGTWKFTWSGSTWDCYEFSMFRAT